MTRHLLICGEPMRGDDGAAFAALERLSETLAPDVEVRQTRAPAPDDFIAVGPSDWCVVVDAVRGISPGEVITAGLDAILDGTAQGPVSTHTLPLRDSLRIASAVAGCPPAGLFVGIGGSDFTLGQSLSETVVAALDDLVDAVAAALERHPVGD